MLMAHVDSTYVSETQLHALPQPPRRGSMHQPVPHGVLVSAIKEAALERGFQVRQQQFALGRQGQRMFGVMDLLPPEGTEQPEEHGFAIGFRNSTDETLAIKIVAGARVFVCDNLALSGDLIALQKRNTTGLDLPAAMSDGFDRYLAHTMALNQQIVELRRYLLSTAEAKARILDLFTERVLPMRLFHYVTRNYFNPTDAMPDCRPRTAWGLHNACTRALKLLTPARRFPVNVELGRAFGLRDTR